MVNPRGVNSFLKLVGGSSNAVRRRCPSVPSILTKSGGGNCPTDFGRIEGAALLLAPPQF